MKILEQFKAARRVSVPLIAIRTPDMAATIRTVGETLNGKAPVVCWDVIGGLRALNDMGEKVLADAIQDGAPGDVLNPAEAMRIALAFPEGTVLFLMNAQRHVDNPAAAQAAWNLRDPFKSNRRTLVMLAPDITLPPELARDVLILDEPYPTPTELATIIREAHEAAQLPVPKDTAKAVDALLGLAAFPAEQGTAMCLTKNGLNIEQLWQHKYQSIDQTKGLSVDRGVETFADIGGLEQIKRFSTDLMAGPYPPKVVCRIEEIEKMLAGAKGDLTGISQDALQVILTEMEDQDYAGIIAVGPPGSGKSLYSKSLGKTFQIPAITLDLGAAKGSLVSESETYIRVAMKTIRTIAGKGGAFFVATSNRLDVVPPELRRRFRFGIWYWDLPTVEERKSIWKINLEKYQLTKKSYKIPDDTNLTGADIRSICEIAWRLSRPLEEAMSFIVPVAKSDPQGIEDLRNVATGRYLSASYPGTYRREKPIAQQNRAINL